MTAQTQVSRPPLVAPRPEVTACVVHATFQLRSDNLEFARFINAVKAATGATEEGKDRDSFEERQALRTPTGKRLTFASHYEGAHVWMALNPVSDFAIDVYAGMVRRDSSGPVATMDITLRELPHYFRRVQTTYAKLWLIRRPEWRPARLLLELSPVGIQLRRTRRAWLTDSGKVAIPTAITAASMKLISSDPPRFTLKNTIELIVLLLLLVGVALVAALWAHKPDRWSVGEE